MRVKTFLLQIVVACCAIALSFGTGHAQEQPLKPGCEELPPVQSELPKCPDERVSVPDPAVRGSHAIGYVRYSLKANFEKWSFDPILRGPGFPISTCFQFQELPEEEANLNAEIRYPAIANTKDAEIAGGHAAFPLLIFVHGAGGLPDELNDLLDIIVSQGAIVVTIRGFSDDKIRGVSGEHEHMIECRAHAIAKHLRFLNALAYDRDAGIYSGVGARFRKRIDMSRIGLIGGSRGGEAVLLAALRYQNGQVPKPDHLFQIRGIISIGPSDDHADTRNPAQLTLNIPWLGVAGGYDRDQLSLTVSFYERISGTGVKTLAVIPGADHHLWKDGQRPASAATIFVEFVKRNIFDDDSVGPFWGIWSTDSLTKDDVRWSAKVGGEIPIEDFENPPENKNELGGENLGSSGVHNVREQGITSLAGPLKYYSGEQVLDFVWAGTAEFLFKARQPDFEQFIQGKKNISFSFGRLDEASARAMISVGLRDTCNRERFVSVRSLSRTLERPDGSKKTILETRDVPVRCFTDTNALNSRNRVSLSHLKEIVLRIEGPWAGNIVVRSVTAR